jgi:hypothetical protein
VLSAVGAISSCLEQGGCAVVPGLPYNQYQLTLITSIIGGFIFGYSTTIRNQGVPAAPQGIMCSNSGMSPEVSVSSLFHKDTPGILWKGHPAQLIAALSTQLQSG